jgi:transcriptional regulator with XRE-family HTH domain
MASSEFKLVINYIRKLMKERGMTYKELARRLNISESGVKKILNGGDASFGRLTEIARALGLTLSDLLSGLEKPKSTKTQFSPKQQEYFLKHMDVFRFFFRLVIERASLARIEKEEGLSKAESFSYLRRLDDLKIIQLLPGDEVRLPPLSAVKNFGEGPLLEKIYQDWAIDLVKEKAHPDHQENSEFIVRYLRLSDETFQEFKQRLKELELDVLRKGLREMNLYPDKLKSWRWISLTDQKSYIKKIR